MGKKRFTSKTYLKILIAVGVLAVVGGGAGTFATFNATTTNAGNTFATGTLVLQNTISATSCLSTGVGTTDTNINSVGCAKFFNTTISKPGDIAGANLTLQNQGSIAATILNLTASTCTDSNNLAESFHGTGSVCGALNFYVQEWSNAGFSTPYKCWYGGGTLSTCDATFATSPVSLSGFGTGTHNISIGPAATAFTALGGAADSRWFTVAVQLPSSSGNTFQGRQAQVDLSWQESQ